MKKLLLLSTLIFLFSATVLSQTYLWRIDSTTTVFNQTCFVRNYFYNGTFMSSGFYNIVNDTCYLVAFQEVSQQEPHLINKIACPMNPTVGTTWDSYFYGPAIYYIQSYVSIIVPAGMFNCFEVIVTDSATQDYKGYLYMNDSIGMIAFEYIYNINDTSKGVLENYSILGGQSVFPLYIGNWHEYSYGEVILNTNDIFQNLNISFYPNPTCDNINLQYTKEDNQITIFNLQGQLVYQEDLNTTNNQVSKKIDLSHLPKALYMIKITSENGIRVGKVVKN